MKIAYILTLLASIGAITGVSLICLKKAQNITFKPSKMAQELTQQQKETHDQALKAIKDEFKISDKLWAGFMDLYQQNKDNDRLLGQWQPTFQKGESEAVQLTKKLLAEYGINGDAVTIKQVKYVESPAQAVQRLADDGTTILHAIELNSAELNKYDKPLQEAIIGHEIMHLINYDSLEASYVLGILYNAGYLPQECDKSPAMIAYRHQRELRADLLSACSSIKVAQAAHDHFEQLAQCPGKPDPFTHPSYVQRIDQLGQLINQMQTYKIV